MAQAAPELIKAATALRQAFAAAADSSGPRGPMPTVSSITALELDADGLITTITSAYDSRQIDPASKRSLIEASTR